MANANDELIERFYLAFGTRDGDTMAACYAPDATFSDPVFPGLRGHEPGSMWRMLTSGEDSDLTIELADHQAAGDTGSAHWIARYTFPKTGRKVLNDIRASFTFTPDGLIARHVDDFDFYAWARQALGPLGLVLGWTPIVRGQVRKQARTQLDEFIAADRPAAG